MNASDRDEREFLTLIDAFPDAVFLHDADGVILLANQRVSENLGYDRDTLIGEPIWTFARDPDRSQIRERWRKLAPGSTERFEGQHERDDGSTFPVEVHVTKLERGRDERFLATVRDVTERRERERELRRQNERLDEFAGTLTHDLRNPLSVAQGHLELARDSGGEEHFRSVEQALDRIEHLIDDMLSLARDGRTVEDSDWVALSEIADLCWANVATAEASVTVETAVHVKADEGRLKQAFENLYRNAIDHAGEAASIRIGRLDDDGFFIEDDGPGIPPEARQQVFEAGYTTDESGTGLGLTIVQDIAEAHGWDVAVTSGSAGGARFEFRNVTLAASRP